MLFSSLVTRCSLYLVFGGLVFASLSAQAQWTAEQDQEYTKRFNEGFHAASPVPSLSAYATIDRYDALYPSEQLEKDLQNINNSAGGIAWGWAYRMMAQNAMVRRTHNVKYLQDNLKCVRAVLAARDDVRGVTLWTGAIAPVWSSDKYAERGRAVFAVHTGMIAYPILDFLQLAQDSPEMKSRLKDESSAILQSVQESLRYHDRQWREGPAPEEGHYIGMDQENALEGKPLPGNRLSSMGRALWCLSQLTGNAEDRRRALAIGRYIRHRLTLAADGAYYWSYWLPLQPSPPIPKEKINAEDISHGSLTMALPILLVSAGEVFTREDMERLGKTVTQGLARLNNGVLFGEVNGNPKSSPSLVQIPGRWLHLTPFVPEVYDRIALYLRTYQAKPSPLDLALLLRYDPTFFPHDK